MLSTPAPTLTGTPCQIFLYAAPVILAFSVSICCLRLFLTYFLQSQRRRHQDHSRVSSSNVPVDFDAEQPSSLSLAFSRSPFFELFRQAPPPPTYDDSVKHLQMQNRQIRSLENGNTEVYEAPPVDISAPPGYSHESRANPV